MSRVFKVDYIPDPDRGRPLWNAKIYVGIPNEDPTIPSNQIQLTGDIGFPVGQSIPVPQPVRTNKGGVTVYNNSPLDLNAPGQQYAIAIYDRNDNLIYNFPQVDGSVVMNTTSQEEVTGLTIWPEVGEAVIGQTIPAGTDAIRYPFNGRSTLFTIKPPVAVTGLITDITINSSGIGTLEVDNSDVYDLAEFNSFIAANDGDSQLAGGDIWPLSSQDSLSLGAQSSDVSPGVDRLRVSTGDGANGVEILYLWEPSGDFDVSAQTITNITANSTGGYDIVTSIQTYEFVTEENLHLRNKGNIYGWGVSGDGTGDDYPGWQAANDYILSVGGGVLTDKPTGGQYLLSDTFIPYHNVSLDMAGPFISNFIANHSNSDVVSVGRPLPYTFDSFKQEYKGFKVTPAPLGVQNRGFVAMRNLDCSFKDIEVETPVDLKTAFEAFRVSGAVYTSYFEQIYVHLAGNPTGGTKGVGFHIGKGENEVGNEFAKTNDLTFVSCSALSFLNNWHLDTCRGVTLINPNAEKSTGAGFLDTGSEFCSIIGAWTELTSGLGVDIKEGTPEDGSGGLLPARPSTGLTIMNSRRNIGDIRLNQANSTTLTQSRPGATIEFNDTNTINCFIDDLSLDQTTFINEGSGTIIRSKIGDEYQLSAKRTSQPGFNLRTKAGGFSLSGVANVGDTDERGIAATGTGNTEVLCGFRGLEITGDAPFFAMPVISSQPTPATGIVNMYMYDNGGTTELRMRNSSGNIVTIATF